MELMSTVFGKAYPEIKEKDLNEFIDGICARMMLFDGQFPSFLPHLIKEVVSHPNIAQTDKDQLESYSDMFEIRWREDSERPLMVSPIYLSDSRRIESDLDRSEVADKMRLASIPYMEDLKKKMMKFE
jgi:hypothetical protein